MCVCVCLCVAAPCEGQNHRVRPDRRGTARVQEEDAEIQAEQKRQMSSFAALPSDVVRLIRRFATEPHPLAKMIRTISFVDTSCEKITLTEGPDVTFLTVVMVRRGFRYDPETMRFEHTHTRPCVHRGRVLLTSIRDAWG